MFQIVSGNKRSKQKFDIMALKYIYKKKTKKKPEHPACILMASVVKQNWLNTANTYAGNNNATNDEPTQVTNIL